VALLLLQYTFAMPTSRHRTRFYEALFGAPWSRGALLLGLLLAVGWGAAALTGWRSRWAAVGTVLGAVLAFLLLYSGVFGYLVWRYDEEVTRAGQWLRAVATVLLAGLVLLWVRQARK
jgi:hypothetical protein